MTIIQGINMDEEVDQEAEEHADAIVADVERIYEELFSMLKMGKEQASLRDIINFLQRTTGVSDRLISMLGEMSSFPGFPEEAREFIAESVDGCLNVLRNSLREAEQINNRNL